MTTNYKLDKDLHEAQQMAAALHDYILGTELYGHSGGMFGSGTAPALTVGALVMRLRRLHAQAEQMNAVQRQVLATAHQQHATIQREWTLHYEQKVIREALSRLDAMRAFFREARDHPPQAPSLYPPELLRRTIVQELRRVMDEQTIQSDQVPTRMTEIDGLLRSVVTPTTFQWDPTLQAYYPSEEFWWLYAAPITSEPT
jgi:hypothetical protein